MSTVRTPKCYRAYEDLLQAGAVRGLVAIPQFRQR